MRLTVYGFEPVISGLAREEYVAFGVPDSNPNLRVTIALSDSDLPRIRAGLLAGSPVELEDYRGDPVAVKLVDEGCPKNAGY